MLKNINFKIMQQVLFGLKISIYDTERCPEDKLN